MPGAHQAGALTPLVAGLADALRDRYRVIRELGAGGMATVYLAEDLRHGRNVALKVLRPELSAVIGAERFLAEIRTTAALQHPNIAPLFDSGEADGQLFYVMPFVEGETLRARLAREKQLPVADAVRIATEVALALDYAHRHGVIHRDIKPENVLLHDGRAMVADFGIALAVTTAGGSTRMTETGMSLGTPSYMSPEQAMGEREITARSDVYALGAVLYEMLIGEPPFTGPTAQAIVARVVTGTPTSPRELRATVPEHVDEAVLTALQRLPADRFASAAEFAHALGTPGWSTGLVASVGTRAGAVRKGRMDGAGWRAVAFAAGAVALVSSGIAAWSMLRPEPPRPTRRWIFSTEPGQEPHASQLGINVAITRDGRTIAYVGRATGGDQLWIRQRDRLDATLVPGSEGAQSPFFSPDGRHVGFFSGGNFTFKVAPVDGGAATAMSEGGAGSGGGGVWGDDGYVYVDSPRGFVRMRPTGGNQAELVVPLDSARGEVGFAWPDLLPDGRAIILRARTNLAHEDFQLFAIDLATGRRYGLGPGLIARYADGHLLVLRADGVLLATPFDAKRRRYTGTPVQLASGVRIRTFGSADFAVSREGTLLYAPGASIGTAGFARGVWVSRGGIEEPMDTAWSATPRQGTGPEVSPDGRFVAYEDNTASIWVKRLPRGPASRLTVDHGPANRPVWLPGGEQLAYALLDSGDNGRVWVMARRADGAGRARRIFTPPNGRLGDLTLSRDGRWIVYRTSEPGRARDIMAVPMGDSVPRAIVAGTADEHSPALSPDGRWVAYVSDETGRAEVYVRPFPNSDDGRWQVSTEGGLEPRWAPDGRTLYFRRVPTIYAVPIAGGRTLEPGEPRVFATTSLLCCGPGVARPTYSVARDGRLALFKVATDAAGVTGLVVVEGWR